MFTSFSDSPRHLLTRVEAVYIEGKHTYNKQEYIMLI